MGNCALCQQGFFFQRGKIEDTQKFWFSVKLSTVHSGAVSCLLSDVSVRIEGTAPSYMI